MPAEAPAARAGGSGRGRRRLLRRAGAVAGAGLLSLSGRLTRVTLHDEFHAERARSGPGSVIFAFWHGRFWLLAASLRRYRAAVMVSLSEDGEVIATAARRLGYHPVRGSSSRGGREGLAELARCLAEGRSVALTPDGPRGPRHVAQMGAVALAARTARPIVPLGAASRPAWSFRSWDRFQVPRPFARGHIVFGEPLLVPAAEDLEPWRIELEARLTAVEERADLEAAG